MKQNNEQYHSASYCKYLVQYHIIWCPKFSFSILQNDIEIVLKQIISNIYDKYKYNIKTLDSKTIFQSLRMMYDY